MKNIAIIAATLHGNRGAEAMLSATIGRLRQRHQDATFHVLSYYPEQDRALNIDSAVRIHDARPIVIGALIFPLALVAWIIRRLTGRRWRPVRPRALAALAESEILIDLAGVSFIDGREVFLLYNTLSIWPSMLLGVPVVKLAQAIGPISSRLNRLVAKPTLARCAAVFGRGEETMANLKRLGLENSLPASDVAFLYRDEYSLTREPLKQGPALELLSRVPRTRPLVAICPSSLLHEATNRAGVTYVSYLSGLVDQLARDNIDVLLFPNATRAESQKRRNNDIVTIRSIIDSAELGRSSNVAFIDQDLNTAAIRNVVRRANVVVTSRFHAMVACLSLATPVCVVGWSHKYREVMSDFGMEQFVFDWAKGVGESLGGQVIAMLQQREALSERIAEHLPAVIDQSSSQFLWLERHCPP